MVWRHLLLGALVLATACGGTAAPTIRSAAGDYVLTDSMRSDQTWVVASGGRLALTSNQTYTLDIPAAQGAAHYYGSWEIESSTLIGYEESSALGGWQGTVGGSMRGSPASEMVLIHFGGSLGGAGYAFARR